MREYKIDWRTVIFAQQIEHGFYLARVHIYSRGAGGMTDEVQVVSACSTINQNQG